MSARVQPKHELPLAVVIEQPERLKEVLGEPFGRQCWRDLVIFYGIAVARARAGDPEALRFLQAHNEWSAAP